MIRIHKPASPPEILRTLGAKARRALCTAYNRSRKRYDEGARSFEFDAGLYGHSTVKEALKKVQYGKCAFCESKLDHISYGDIEHFRPKAGWRQLKGGPLQRPGYYWLVYEWTNLFLACTLCNQAFKENLFPLGIPSRRALDHTHDVGAEDPLFIDPAADDPEAFISFREEVPYALQGNPRGEHTIELLGLRREALAERRRDRLGLLKALEHVARLGIPQSADARQQLASMVKDDSEYAAMARAYLKSQEPPAAPRASKSRVRKQQR